jgi:monoamine oxidase
LGNTSNQAKQRWNTDNYTQVKVSVKPETAAAFKAACAASNVSMSGVISQFMAKYCGSATKKGGYSPELSTKRQRRAAVRFSITLLERIKTNEEQYRDNIPENLQGSIAFETAENSISALCEAIDLLETAY